MRWLLPHSDDPAAASPDPGSLGGLDGAHSLVIGVGRADLRKVGAAGFQIMVERCEACRLELSKLLITHNSEGGVTLYQAVLRNSPDPLDKLTKIR